MSLFELFFVFFKIGLFSFGGGYGMIPLINSELLSRGVISEQALIDFIGVAESTPGPFAVNIATFVGSSIGGFLGSVVATVAVVLPAFIIILIVSSLLKNFSKNKYVKGFLSGVEPFVVGLIVSTGISIIVKNIWINYGVFYAVPMIVINNAIVTLSLFALTIVYKKIFKKNMSSILLIIISAIVGIIFM
jgi:chromate transporter